MGSSLTLIAVIISVGFLFDSRAAESRPGMTLALREKAVANGPEILLGDLAELPESNATGIAGLAGLSLGPSPMPGETRIVTSTEVHRILETAALPGISVGGAARTRVTRSSRPLPEAEVAQALRAHLAAISGWQADEIEVRAIRKLNDVSIPEGSTTSLHVLQRSAPVSFRNLSIPMEVSVDGRPVRTIWVTADIRITATVAQATKRLPYGTVLTGDDFKIVRAEIPDPRSSYIRSAEMGSGKVLRRTLKPGELITGDALSDPLLVRNGDTVRLRLENSNIRVVMLARAEQNGRMGQSIRIRNLDFARTLRALVVGPGEVLVQ